ncbi:MAG: leucine-rich repeat protein [Oscillospiraceae bacterium]|nr:leucine-rich repeat protein [Oscillospiraceae bacterium]
MAKMCYGCMREKEQIPVCEHCGYDERSRNKFPWLPAGLILHGQYLIGKMLDHRNFAAAYLGWDMNLEQPVIIKEFYPKVFSNRESLGSLNVISGSQATDDAFEQHKQGFLKVAKQLAKMRNLPQIVHVLNFFEENNTAYIVMEHVEGMNLHDYLKHLGRPMTAAEVYRVLEPVMDALHKVHQSGLNHLDIGPDNIIIQPDGTAKLLGFGAAGVRENMSADGGIHAGCFLEPKHGFAAIEQYQVSGTLGPWSDVFGIGATIYYCMTGTVLSGVVDGIPIDWTLVKGMTDRQMYAMHKAMEIEPDRRFRSMKDFLEELNPLARPLDELKIYGETTAAVEDEPMETMAEAPQMTEIKMPGMDLQKKAEKKPLTKRKKLMIGILAAVVVLAAIAAFVLTPKYEFYTTQNDEQKVAVITGYSGYMPRELELPGKLKGYTVVSIGSDAFKDQVRLEHVVIPDSVQKIEEGAFYGCRSLESIVLPRDLKSIGDYAFYRCDSLMEITFPEGMESIGVQAFYRCNSLREVTIPGTVHTICDGAFTNCAGLEKVDMLSGVERVGNNAFYCCEKLATISIAPTVYVVGADAFRMTPWFDNQTAEFVIYGKDVLIKYNGDDAGVIIPTIRYIGGSAFYGNEKLTSVEFPRGLVGIYGNAFYGCSNLAYALIPDNLKFIEDYAFAGTNLQIVSLPEMCKVGQEAFPKSCGVKWRS